MTCHPLTETTFSPRRGELCSRENAHRVAERLFEHKHRQGAVIRTGDPIKPFPVTDEDAFDVHVEVELRA